MDELSKIFEEIYRENIDKPNNKKTLWCDDCNDNEIIESIYLIGGNDIYNWGLNNPNKINEIYLEFNVCLGSPTDLIFKLTKPLFFLKSL